MGQVSTALLALLLSCTANGLITLQKPSSYGGAKTRRLRPRCSAFKESEHALPSLRRRLHEWLCGSWDNKAQVVNERRQGLLPGELGGHEQVHVRLEPVQLPPASLLGADHILGATYYFDGKREAVFRCRLYAFDQSTPDASRKTEDRIPVSHMSIYRFMPELESRLREECYDLSRLPQGSANDIDAVVEHLEGCGITWEWDAREGVFFGYMREGCCVIASQKDPSMKLRIEDGLRLAQDRLDVNDRGYDYTSGRLVYGNHRGVPYSYRRSHDL